MSTIEHNTTATVILSEAECTTVNTISDNKVSELSQKVLEAAIDSCNLNTWYHENAGRLCSVKRRDEYDCDLISSERITEQGDVVVRFICDKALCRGEDAPIRAAEKLGKVVAKAVDAVEQIRNL